MEQPENSLEIVPGIVLAEIELQESFVRASGPGGQNVNKVSTAVELRFDVRQSPCLPEWLRQRVLARPDRRLTAEGVLVIMARQYRTQERNRQDARQRLIALLRAATITQPVRRATRPTRGSQERRLQDKKARGNIKRQRQRDSWDKES